MLKGVSSIVSPELLKIIAEMGHGDEIVLADANYPAVSNTNRLVRCDGHPMPPLLEALLGLIPLDQYVDQPVALMAVVPGDDTKPVIWDEYKKIISRYDKRAANFEFVERFAFYERSRGAFAIVATGEGALYANIILKKGVIKP